MLETNRIANKMRLTLTHCCYYFILRWSWCCRHNTFTAVLHMKCELNMTCGFKRLTARVMYSRLLITECGQKHVWNEYRVAETSSGHKQVSQISFSIQDTKFELTPALLWLIQRIDCFSTYNGFKMMIKTQSLSLPAYWECDGEFKSVLSV